MNEPVLPQTTYCYVISHEFKAIISTNAGPLSLPGKDACEMANIYSAAYPGANFWAVYTTSPQAPYYAANYIQLPIDPANSGGLCWSVLSKLEWLERFSEYAELGWLSAVTRQV